MSRGDDTPTDKLLKEEARFVRLEEAMKTVNATLNEIKGFLSSVVKLETNITTALAKTAENAQDTTKQWERIDELRLRIEGLESYRARLNGATWVASGLALLFGGLFTSAVIWLVSTVSAGDRLNEVQQTKIEQDHTQILRIEQQLDRVRGMLPEQPERRDR